MRILVTGGAGFIGSRVVRALRDAGNEIRVLDSLVAEVHPEDGYRPPAGVEFGRADLTDGPAVRAALRGVDLVSHQAAMVGRGREILDAPTYASSNVLGTAVLLAAMTEAGISRMVLGSSVVIYGDSRYDCATHGRVLPARRSRADLDAGHFEPRCPRCGTDVVASAVREDDPLDPPRNVYAVTKLAQEHLVAAWARETGATAAALRYHNVYGPGMPQDSPYSGVAATFRSAVERGEAPRVFEDGKPLRDFVHVQDVAAANVAAVARHSAGFRAFNVASGVPRSIGELAAALAAARDAPAPRITGEYRIGDVRHIFASPQRAAHELNWTAGTEFTAGVQEFARGAMRVAESG